MCKLMIRVSAFNAQEKAKRRARKAGEKNMKKLMTLGVMAFAFAMTFGVASASYFGSWGNNNSTKVNNTNNATVNNNVTTSSNTGSNFASSGFSFHSSGSFIGTGNAVSGTTLNNYVGENDTRVTGVQGDTTVNNTNDTHLTNTVTTSSNTGRNTAWGGMTLTGGAGSASSLMNMIGSNFTVVK